MAELPFADPAAPDNPAPYLVDVPRGTTIRTGIVAGAVAVCCLGGAALWLFGWKAATQAGRRPAVAVAEPMPRQSNTGDPLRGVQTDYSALLTKPQSQLAPAPFAPATPVSTPHTGAPQPAGAGRRTEQREQGVLVVQGKVFKQVSRAGAPVSPPDLPPPVAAPPHQAPLPEQGAASVVERQRAYLAQAQQLRATEVQDRLHLPTRYSVMAGDIIPAALVTGIESDLPGELVARVRQDVRDSVTGQTVLIPQGTTLIGTYSNDISYGQGRVLVVWYRLRLPNGQSIQLEGFPGIDLSGMAGLKDRVDQHLWPLLRGVILSSVLSMGSRVPAGSSPQNYQPNLAQEFSADFGAAAHRAGQQIISRELSRPPTITIRPGMAFSVFVLRDLPLMPYTGEIAYGR